MVFTLIKMSSIKDNMTMESKMAMENSQMLYINILEISNIIYTMEMDNLLSIKISMLDSSNKE